MRYYLSLGNAFYQVEAPSPQAAKRLCRYALGLRKLPPGSVVSSDIKCGFFHGQTNFEELTVETPL